MTDRNNLSKVFSEIISLDAWHSGFSDIDDTASVHVDLSFLEGNLGGEKGSKVRFNLALKRAELVFVIPEMESIKVIQNSVDREEGMTGLSKYMRENQSQILNSGKAALNIASNPSISAELNSTLSGKINDHVVGNYILEKAEWTS